MIKEAISQVIEGKSLGKNEAKEVFDEIMSGKCTDAQIASFITALRMKGESVEEITGAAESMRNVVAKVNYSGKEDLLDIVGTGGDKKSTFNISTASFFVAAGAGCIVAKHGNKSVSSKSGAADVLTELGINVETLPERNSQILSKIGLTFMFAPKHHPAMKYAIGPRKEIGVRTIFNILGPITNPANANTYLLGAYSKELAEKLANVLLGLNVKKAIVVHGSGYDEATLVGKTAAFIAENNFVTKIEFAPGKFGFSACSDKDLMVDSPKESAEIIKKILEGKEKGPKRDIVLLNAGIAIYANGKAKSISNGIEMAKNSIESGKALAKLMELLEESNK